MDPKLEQRLREGAENLGVSVAANATSALGRYLDLLILWNRRVNLSAIRDPDDIVEKHFVDSIAVVPHIPTQAETLVDVGSGAGFPGAVIAVLRPDLRISLVESIHKKTAFLEALRRELPLPNLTVLTARAETLPATSDVAVSRATWALPEWLDRGRNLVVSGGTVLGMEGAELHDLPPGATRHPYHLGTAQRAIIVFHVEH